MLPPMAYPRVYRAHTVRPSENKRSVVIGPIVTGNPGEDIEAIAERAKAEGLDTVRWEWLANNGRWFCL